MGVDGESTSVSGQEIHVFGLLDFLILIAENSRRLLGWSLAAGVVAYAATFLVIPRHVSHAILALPSNPSAALGPLASVFQVQTAAQAAVLMSSPVVLDSVIEKLRLANSRTLPEARLRLAEDVKASVQADGFLHLTVLHEDGTQALAISNAIIDAWRKTTVPVEADRTDLMSRLTYSKESLAAVGQILQGLAAEGGASLKQPLTRGEAGATIVTIGELQNQYLNDVMLLPRLIDGLSRDVVKQPPTLVANGERMKRGLLAVSLAVSVAILVFAWILVRHAWRLAAQDAQTAERQQRLIAALPFARRTRE